jgi:hypothetical protein
LLRKKSMHSRLYCILGKSEVSQRMRSSRFMESS